MTQTTELMADGVHTTFDYRPEPDRLSPSAAKKLLGEAGPARFHYERTHPKKQEPKFDMGKLVHRFILGAGEDVAPIPFPDYRTQAAKGQRDKAYADGLIPALSHEIETAIEMARIVHEHPVAGPLISEGEPEVWLYATDPVTGQKIRLRPDCMTWRDEMLIISDVKTTKDKADRKTFSKRAFDLGFYLQFAFSIVAARELFPGKEIAMVFIAQEVDPPHLVAIHELDADAFRLGRDDMTRACRLFQQCRETGVWPGFSPEIQPVSLPYWATRTDPLHELTDVLD